MSLDKLKSTNNLDKLLSAVKEDNKDPSDMGFALFTNKIQESQEFNFSSLFNLKLSL